MEWPLIRLAVHRAVQWRFHIHQIVDAGEFDARARILVAEMSVAVMGEQDRISQEALRTNGVPVGRVRVMPRSDQENRIRRRRVPRSAVGVLASPATRRTAPTATIPAHVPAGD